MFELYESIAITFPGCVDSFNATSFNATCTGNPSLELIGSGWQVICNLYHITDLVSNAQTEPHDKRSIRN